MSLGSTQLGTESWKMQERWSQGSAMGSETMGFKKRGNIQVKKDAV